MVRAAGRGVRQRAGRERLRVERAVARHLPKRPGDGHGSECDQAHVALRVALGEEACNAAWAAGPAMPLDEAIALALASQAEPWQGP